MGTDRIRLTSDDPTAPPRPLAYRKWESHRVLGGVVLLETHVFTTAAHWRRMPESSDPAWGHFRISGFIIAWKAET